jgi:acetyl-CoA C-acetyltransferase
MSEAVILSAVRTPIGKLMGALSSVPAPRLGAIAIDDVLMGEVITAGVGQAPARQAALFAGLPAHVPTTTINKVCGSGLRAVMLAAQAIRAGDANVIVAGGMESMSQAPHLVHMREGARFGNQSLHDANYHDGLLDPFENWAMGNAAEFIADEYCITREAMDQFALASHQKALAAIDAGKFKDEIAPVQVKDQLFQQDEAPRRDTSLAALATLKPAFKADGKVTAGNAPGLNDGAAALIIASKEAATRMSKTPFAKIVGYAQAAVEPRRIFIAPAHAIPKLLQKIGWSLRDVELIELNEAFAAQVLADGCALEKDGWDWDKVNVNGGAIALGHPIGASGARVLTTLVHALRNRGLQRGIAALCLGGGEAVAMAVEVDG